MTNSNATQPGGAASKAAEPLQGYAARCAKCGLTESNPSHWVCSDITRAGECSVGSHHRYEPMQEESTPPSPRPAPVLGLSDAVASVTRDAQVFRAALEIALAKMAGAGDFDAAVGWWGGIAEAVREGRNSLLAEQRRLMERRGQDALLADIAEAGDPR